MTQKLPDKPSELIELALGDLRKVERDERYMVAMELLHCPQKNGKCSVCFAGAIVAQRFDVPTDATRGLDSFGLETERKLRALDLFRQGFVEAALGMLELKMPKKLNQCVPVKPYNQSARKFKSDMRSLAVLLREHNL